MQETEHHRHRRRDFKLPPVALDTRHSSSSSRRVHRELGARSEVRPVRSRSALVGAYLGTNLICCISGYLLSSWITLKVKYTKVGFLRQCSSNIKEATRDGRRQQVQVAPARGQAAQPRRPASLSSRPRAGGRPLADEEGTSRRLLPHNNMSEVYCRGGLDPPRSRWPFHEALPGGERASDLPSVRPTFSLLGVAFSCALQAAGRRRRPCHLPASLTHSLDLSLLFQDPLFQLGLPNAAATASSPSGARACRSTLCAPLAPARPPPARRGHLSEERPFLLSLVRFAEVATSSSTSFSLTLFLPRHRAYHVPRIT